MAGSLSLSLSLPLCFSGLTNPPGNIYDPKEVPYPVDSLWYAKYKVNWTAPLFTGGLSSLHYNITISPRWSNDEYSQSSNTNSVVIPIEPDYPVDIYVAVINPAINSSEWMQHPHSVRYFRELISFCVNKGNNMTLCRIVLIKHTLDNQRQHLHQYCCACRVATLLIYYNHYFLNILVVLHPPSPFVVCGHGLVTLFWRLSEQNHRLFGNDGGVEHVYTIGYCNLTNGSVYPVSMLCKLQPIGICTFVYWKLMRSFFVIRILCMLGRGHH